nr:conotoxin precursor K [Conus ebraeus]DAZ86170.1 TPA_inf: conotoxin precursor K [Conus ebraeus]
MNMRMMLTLFVLVVMTTVSTSEHEAKKRHPCDVSVEGCLNWCKELPYLRHDKCCRFVDSIPDLSDGECEKLET